jgi:hypothetical protein
MENYVDILWNKNVCILQFLLVLLPDTALLRMLVIQEDIFSTLDIISIKRYTVPELGQMRPCAS